MENTTQIENTPQTKNTNLLVPYNTQNRIVEKDGLSVQFFDKIKQTTDNYLQTIDILDKKNKPVFGLYIEIFNPNDHNNIVCKEVETEETDNNGKKGKKLINNISYSVRDGNNNSYSITTNYGELYPKALENYKAMRENKVKPHLTFAEQLNTKVINNKPNSNNFI